jgi:branched-chain amino acid transport system ATP-binding protein
MTVSKDLMDVGSGSAGSSAREPLLAVRNLTMRFGGLTALDGVDFDVFPSEICGLIGPNGAGKTTLFNCLCRVVKPQAGTITFDGRSMAGLPAHEIGRLGIARTFQNVALFPTLSVLDNVLIACHGAIDGGFLAATLAFRSMQRSEQEATDRVERILSILGLAAIRHRTVRGLPFALQKRVEFARALALRPRLLLLDEPAGGLSHEEVAALGAFIRSIRSQFETAILLVEHHLNLVMDISDRIVVLDFGKKVADDNPARVKADSQVIQAYLGRPN